MYIIFTDESGQPGGFDIEKKEMVKNTSKYFVIGGFMIMLIADSRKNNTSNKLDKELQKAYLRAKNMGTYFVEFPNFCESIVFVDSDYYLGVQIADFCAGAIYKKYENNDERFFERIKPAIRKYKGNIYGPGIKLY